MQSKMIDLHCHSLFSDGELLPSELVRRCEVMGYMAVAITDHADASNLTHIISNLQKVAEEINTSDCKTKLLVGVELTHVRPSQIPQLAIKARGLGAQIIVVHGETIVEPVCPDTNKAALEADIDILAHPGFITLDEANMAAQRGIFLEISGRKGHSLTNGHVVKQAKAAGAQLIIDSDGHAPQDFMSFDFAKRVGMGAGLDEKAVDKIYINLVQWMVQKMGLSFFEINC